MSEHVMSERSPAPDWLSWRHVAAPVTALILLSPVLTELLMGALPISSLWLLVPEMGVYGVGALMIREIVRRQRRGWGAILLLGIALALAIECVILQTSLTPQFFKPAGEQSFGWAFGVNWIYLLAMLGYESVYAVVIPIQLTELLFPSWRNTPWLSRKGLAIASIVFVLSSIGVWWLWSHHGLPRYGDSNYQVPPVYVAGAAVISATLAVATLSLRPSIHAVRQTTRRARSPWLAGLLAFLFGLGLVKK